MFYSCSLTFTLSSFFILTITATAGDWPQILGPHRDGIAVDERLLQEWPGSGPKKIWQEDVEQGFAGVAVKNDIVYVFHRSGGVVIEGVSQVIPGHAVCRL